MKSLSEYENDPRIEIWSTTVDSEIRKFDGKTNTSKLYFALRILRASIKGASAFDLHKQCVIAALSFTLIGYFLSMNWIVWIAATFVAIPIISHLAWLIQAFRSYNFEVWQLRDQPSGRQPPL